MNSVAAAPAPSWPWLPMAAHTRQEDDSPPVPTPKGSSPGTEPWAGQGAVTPHLQGAAVPQPQLLFIVAHGLAVVLHVPQGGSQGHVDDGQLRPRPV